MPKAEDPKDPEKVSPPEPGIRQQAENFTLGGGQQGAIGDDNIQIQGDNNWLGNTWNLFLQRDSSQSVNPRSRVQQLLLKQVSTEVESRLNQSLHNRIYIIQDTDQNPSQIELPWASEIKVGTKPKVHFINTQVTAIYDQPDIAGRLLILGEPGVGKTTMLLKLAEELVNRAKNDPVHPIPVLFSLSSWKNDSHSIKEWLVDQLKDKHGVRKDISKQLVDNQEIIPLLDGLDELAAERQEKCVIKINDFIHNGWSNSLVVSSRIEEYQLYQSLLQLNNSLELHSFTLQQVEQYLKSTDNLELWNNISQDEDLKKLAQIPLILTIIVLSAQEISIPKWQHYNSSEERLAYLFDAYILRMLKRFYKDKKQYKQENTKRWLGWLAQRLIDENTPEFLIEKLQPYWLENENKILVYNCIVYGFFVTLSGWITRVHNLECLGIIVGLIIGQISTKFFIKEQAEKVITSILKHKQSPVVIYYLIKGLIFFSGLPSIFFLINGLIFGWLLGLFLELGEDKIEIIEKLNFSLKKFLDMFLIRLKSALKLGLKLGIGSVIILGLIFVVLSSYDGLIVLRIWLLVLIVFLELYYGLIIGIFSGVFYGMISGLLGQELENKTIPNQGIRKSLTNSFPILLASFLPFILLGFIFKLLFFSSRELLVFIFQLANIHYKNLVERYFWNPSFESILFVGILCAILTVIHRSGISAIKYLFLRVILCSSGYTPWNYAKFLDYCTNRLFLQRVGGGYRFMHDLLRQHFATYYSQKN